MRPGPILPRNGTMKTPTALIAAALLHLAISSAFGDPQVTSWMTANSTRYARIYTSDANRSAGQAVTTWSQGTTSQTAPAYCGVQEISFSTNWIYIRTTGLGSHVMGPWYLNAGRTQLFPNFPKNTKTLYRFPRSSALGTPPATKTLTGLGAIGYFVDGVAMFDSRDGFYWNGSAETGGGGTGYWNREAYVNEGVTFDQGYAHQEQTGTHHYHAQPIALRYLLGDHVDYLPGNKSYAESATAVTKHSPIIGWVRDGYPIYGPYGYSQPLNANSGARRMISGYLLRNGQNGTDNLTTAGRTTIPAWAQRAYGAAASQSGPAVSATYPLGRYMEDNAYRGDLGQTQGVQFDLDEYNGRYCVTPEFPQGTYAYFTSIAADGTPVYPYGIGRCFYGSPTGGAQTSITETVTTHFKGGPELAEAARTPAVNAANGNVTLTWSSVEGGTYKVEASNNVTNWSTLSSTQSAAANATSTSFTENGGTTGNAARFYRVIRTALATYDSVGGTTTGGTGILSVTPTAATRGATFTLTVNLDPAATPAPPPQNAPVNGVTLGTIAGTSRIHVSQTQVTAQFTIPANAATGPQTVTVTFPGPPENPTATVSYTLTNGFTIN